MLSTRLYSLPKVSQHGIPDTQLYAAARYVYDKHTLCIHTLPRPRSQKACICQEDGRMTPDKHDHYTDLGLGMAAADHALV